MRHPIFVRTLTTEERQHLEAGLRSRDAFVHRRCQSLLASARGEQAIQLAQYLGCDDQTVRTAIHAFNAHGLAALTPGSSRPKRITRMFEASACAHLRTIIHQRPRTFGKHTRVWSLDLVAQVCFEQGLTPTRVTGETIRLTLKRLGITWQRAKQWITSPDPAYARKKSAGIA